MHTQIKQEDPKKEILLAMLMADKEKKGYIMASELQSKLKKLGEKLTQKEGNSVAQSADSWRGLGGGHQNPISATGSSRSPQLIWSQSPWAAVKAAGSQSGA